MTKAEEMLNEASGNLAILELASKSLSDAVLMKTVFSVKEKNWGFEEYALEISSFTGKTLRLLMDCQIELDKTLSALQYNANESSEKKGA